MHQFNRRGNHDHDRAALKFPEEDLPATEMATFNTERRSQLSDDTESVYAAVNNTFQSRL